MPHDRIRGTLRLDGRHEAETVHDEIESRIAPSVMRKRPTKRAVAACPRCNRGNRHTTTRTAPHCDRKGLIDLPPLQCPCRLHHPKTASSAPGHAAPFLIRPKAAALGLVSLPSSTGLDIVSAEIVSYLPRLGPHIEWLELVPRRLGHVGFVDDAAAALLQTVKVHAEHSTDYGCAISMYGKAVRSLRTSLTTTKSSEQREAAFVAIALIILAEMMVGSWSKFRRTSVLLHWQGLASLYLTSRDPSQLSDLARAVLFTLWDVTFGIATTQGLPSPFDGDIRWLNLEPPTTCGKSVPAYHLRRLAHALTIHTPRLIRYTRALRSEQRAPVDLQNALALSLELYRLRNDDQESAILHRVGVRSSRGPDLREVCPNSYSFHDIDDFNAAIRYWGSRLIILVNCITILEHCPPAEVARIDDVLTAEHIDKDLQRLVVNILMSWEYAVHVGEFATLWHAKQSLPAFGVLRRWKTLRSISTQKIRLWMFSNVLTHNLNEWLSEDASEEDMDVGFYLLAGGPMKGFIVNASPVMQP